MDFKPDSMNTERFCEDNRSKNEIEEIMKLINTTTTTNTNNKNEYRRYMTTGIINDNNVKVIIDTKHRESYICRNLVNSIAKPEDVINKTEITKNMFKEKHSFVTGLYICSMILCDKEIVITLNIIRAEKYSTSIILGRETVKTLYDIHKNEKFSDNVVKNMNVENILTEYDVSSEKMHDMNDHISETHTISTSYWSEMNGCEDVVVTEIEHSETNAIVEPTTNTTNSNESDTTAPEDTPINHLKLKETCHVECNEKNVYTQMRNTNAILTSIIEINSSTNTANEVLPDNEEELERIEAELFDELKRRRFAEEHRKLRMARQKARISYLRELISELPEISTNIGKEAPMKHQETNYKQFLDECCKAMARTNGDIFLEDDFILRDEEEHIECKLKAFVAIKCINPNYNTCVKPFTVTYQFVNGEITRKIDAEWNLTVDQRELCPLRKVSTGTYLMQDYTLETQNQSQEITDSAEEARMQEMEEQNNIFTFTTKTKSTTEESSSNATENNANDSCLTETQTKQRKRKRDVTSESDETIQALPQQKQNKLFHNEEFEESGEKQSSRQGEDDLQEKLASEAEEIQF